MSAAEMRALDRWTIEHGTPGHVLMERAGTGAARLLRTRVHGPRKLVVVVCGRGNNGGDGFVMARLLRRTGMAVEVWLAARPEEVRGDAAGMLARWQRGRGRVRSCTDAAGVAALTARLAGAAVVVDALFGTGLNAPVDGVPARIVDAMNACGAPVLAVDIASGLSADTGRPLGVAVRATLTATFGFPKIGQVVHPGVEHSGRLHVIDIGIPTAALEAVRPDTTLLEPETVGNCLPRRPRPSHKGTFGHVLVVAGSRGKLGAALLATEAALRAGAGLATVGVAATLQSSCEGRVREAMTTALADSGEGVAVLGDGAALTAALAGRAAVVCGPGLGTAPGTVALVDHLLRHCEAPVVLDADGLNAVAGTDALRARAGTTVVTPHPGEMARLLATDTAAIQADRFGAARRLAERDGVVVALKGARTLVARPDGHVAICPTGNPGMASGGTGDVLAGIIGGLLAQGLPPEAAAELGVFAHGAAGDAVASARGECGLLARDLLGELPPTLARLQAGDAPRRDA